MTGAPSRAGLVLISLILVAAVANLNLAVANVALPDIGRAFDAGQTALNLVAVGYSLGLAASVLYLGALGDRYGRKLMLILGTSLSIPASLLAALAPSIEVLFVARLFGGLAAGMAFPTTLALITALWSGPGRTKSIALWSGLGGAIAALGPLLSGALLTGFDWGSVFLITLPLAVVALYLAVRFVPAHVNEATDPVDNLGGILSVLLVATLVLAINFAPVPNEGAAALGLAAIAIAAAVAFVVRQRRAKAPLYDLAIAGRRIFWVAACAGIIVFGTLMGAMFVGQQFLQNVLGYSTLEAGAAFLPMTLLIVVIAPLAGRFSDRVGSRWLMASGMTLVGSQLLYFSRLGVHESYAMIVPGMLLGGVGMATVMSPSTAAALSGVPVDKAGVGSAIVNTSRQVGGSIGIALMGAIMAHGLAGRQTPEAFVHGLSTALTVAAIIAFAGAVVAVTLVRAGERLEHRRQRGIAHPVVRPGEPRPAAIRALEAQLLAEVGERPQEDRDHSGEHRVEGAQVALARDADVHAPDAGHQRQREHDHADRGQHAQDVVDAVRDHRLVRVLERLDDLLVVVEQVPDALGGVDEVVEVELEVLGKEALDVALEQPQRRALAPEFPNRNSPPRPDREPAPTDARRA